MTEIEMCCECDDPTGRAGKGEDSLYFDDLGPFCEDCWQDAPTMIRSFAASVAGRMRKEADRFGVMNDPTLVAWAEAWEMLRDAAEIGGE